MYFQYLLLALSLLFSQISSISLTRPHSIRTTNIGNSTHPQLFYQLVASKADKYYNYGIYSIWTLDKGPPSYIRPVNSSSMATLFSTSIYALSSLPADDLSKPYETIGPEYNERLAGLGTRVVVKQYERPSVINGTDYPPKAQPMRNQELLTAAWLLQTLYTPTGSLAPDLTKESAWWGCYLRETWILSRCTATVMIQTDLWS